MTASIARVAQPRAGKAEAGSGIGASGRRGGVLVAFALAAAIGLTACGGASTGTPQVASLPTTDAGATTTTPQPKTSNASSAAKPAKGNPTALLDEWATCMHGHGDPNQSDPTVDAYGGIDIDIPASAQDLSAAVHAGTDPCNPYLAAAQSALRAANPVAPPPDQAQLVKYVGCMRANGVLKYPYPTGNTTNFNGTGVDPNSTSVESADKICGRKLALPAWWIDGTGPPGNVSVQSGRVASPPPGSGGFQSGPATGGNGGGGSDG